MSIFSIYDKKANVHRFVMACTDVPTAVRAVSRTASDGRSDLFAFSDDFALYRLGDVDVNSGIITVVTPIEFIANVSSLIKINESVESK